MTYKELKNKIKEEQKTLAQSIKNGKKARKPSQRNHDNIGDYNGLFWNRINYRHKHIAYCKFFNNTPYGLIEQPREDNRPSKSKIEKYEQEWEGLLDEALRDCA